ncbi:DUF3055 domain-containing protein [Bacillus carboniphilus]|uniref:DUF3055 domain-containing protein n=1 Tax=Bacillus carboniphilus TaxID=86663 RepID=A0ABY9JPG7_9BACI|nr:DUF3055 domain-containing protein [Bacillus carboniphilus]WLR41304.1 DUF3055 domain-containing protein [Bacillus carboniphilus]
MTERFYLYDDTVETKTRFISFMGESQRFDLALIYSDRYYGKVIVLNIQDNCFAIVGHDDLEEEGFIQSSFSLSDDEAEELTLFLQETI